MNRLFRDRIAGRLRSLREPSNAPRVSVVIKSYNHAKYIAKTIDSVLAQTLQDFELVITDDGSTDGTVDVIASYNDSRIKFHALSKNLGIANAMNVSIGRARAPLIAILNSDDYAMPTRLASQVAYLDSQPGAVALFSRPQCVDEAGNNIDDWPIFSVPLAFPDFSQATWLRCFFLKGNYLCAPSAMIRAPAFRAVGPYDRRLTNLSDLDMWVRLLSQGELHVSPDRLTAFRIRDGNANLGAPRVDSQLRSPFEYSEILKHYLAMDEQLLRDVFRSTFIQHAFDINMSIGQLLAETALKSDQQAHWLFALQTLHKLARTDADFERLREVSGSVNVFGIDINSDLRMA